MEKLTDKFRPAMGAAKVEVKLEFQTIRLESVREDPETWISEFIQLKE